MRIVGGNDSPQLSDFHDFNSGIPPLPERGYPLASHPQAFAGPPVAALPYGPPPGAYGLTANPHFLGAPPYPYGQVQVAPPPPQGAGRLHVNFAQSLIGAANTPQGRKAFARIGELILRQPKLVQPLRKARPWINALNHFVNSLSLPQGIPPMGWPQPLRGSGVLPWEAQRIGEIDSLMNGSTRLRNGSLVNTRNPVPLTAQNFAARLGAARIWVAQNGGSESISRHVAWIQQSQPQRTNETVASAVPAGAAPRPNYSTRPPQPGDAPRQAPSAVTVSAQPLSPHRAAFGEDFDNKER